MRTGENIRLRQDGRYEARYIKERDENGKIIYGYCYGHSYEEAEAKRDALIGREYVMKELNLLILGAGSHGEEVMELAQSLRVFQKISFLDDFLPRKAIGPCKDFGRYREEYPAAIAAVGDTALRKRWTRELSAAGFVIPTLIHPTASVSPSTKIGTGTVICAGGMIGTGTVIGKGCIISSAATIARNVMLEDWTYVECGQVITLNNEDK